MSRSAGRFADDRSQSSIFRMLTVCVTAGFRTSTSNALIAVGAQSCSRSTRTASATAS